MWISNSADVGGPSVRDAGIEKGVSALSSIMPHVPRVEIPRHVPHVHLPHVGKPVVWALMGIAVACVFALSTRTIPELDATRVADNVSLAWSEHDPYAVSRLYTPDAVLKTVDGRELVGSEAIASEAARVAEYGYAVWRTAPVSLDGDLVTTSMAYSMTDGIATVTAPVGLVTGTMRSDFVLEDGKIALQREVKVAG